MPFELEITVRFAETDAQGVAHHAAYLVWFETARVEYLRKFAGGYQALRDTGVEATTSEVHARYIRPVAFDDRLVIHTRCTEMRGARFKYEYDGRAGRRAGRRRLDGPCLRRREDDAPDTRARLARRGDYAGGGGGGSFGGGGGGGGSFGGGGGSLGGGGGSGRSFVPYWTTVGSDR